MCMVVACKFAINEEILLMRTILLSLCVGLYFASMAADWDRYMDRQKRKIAMVKALLKVPSTPASGKCLSPFFSSDKHRFLGGYDIRATQLEMVQDNSLHAINDKIWDFQVFDTNDVELARGFLHETTGFDKACEHMIIAMSFETSMPFEHYIKKFALYNDIGDFYIADKHSPESDSCLRLVRGVKIINLRSSQTCLPKDGLRQIAKAIDAAILNDAQECNGNMHGKESTSRTKGNAADSRKVSNRK